MKRFGLLEKIEQEEGEKNEPAHRILYDMVYHTTPILLCVLGLFAYKAGVLNIALEGMMLAGSFYSCLCGITYPGYLAHFISQRYWSRLSAWCLLILP